MFARIPYHSKVTDVVVIYATATKAFAWVLDQSADVLIQSTERKIISASPAFFQRYQVSSPIQFEKLEPFIKIEKGTVASCTVDGETIKGLVTGTTKKGIALMTEHSKYTLPFYYLLTPIKALELPESLKEWSAISNS